MLPSHLQHKFGCFQSVIPEPGTEFFFHIFGDIWMLLGNGVIVGQWFPTRKGTVMGIATFAFPIGTGVFLTLFANLFYSRGALAGFAPYLLIGVVAVLILVFALANYPEEVGCFRDNDQSMSKEKAEEGIGYI